MSAIKHRYYCTACTRVGGLFESEDRETVVEHVERVHPARDPDLVIEQISEKDR